MQKSGKTAVIVSILIALLLVMTFVFAAKPTGHCKDGQDNDGDGLIDLNDPGCSDKNDQSELNPEIECDDGSDNDGDSAIDYNDSGCASPTDDDETDCGDGVCEGGETYVTCPADCPIPDSCNDTDGGWNLEVQGTISGYDDGEEYSETDYCINNETVIEHYCGGVNPYSYNISCVGNLTGYCSNGACVV